MSRAAYLLLRDRADWLFAMSHGLPVFFSGTYELALREQAMAIIGKGC